MLYIGPARTFFSEKKGEPKMKTVRPKQEDTEEYGTCKHCGQEVPISDLQHGYCSLCCEEESEGDI